MRARDLDLGTLWEDVCIRFEERGLRVPPRRWRIVHAVMQEILIWGCSTGIGPQGVVSAARRLITAARKVGA